MVIELIIKKDCTNGLRLIMQKLSGESAMGIGENNNVIKNVKIIDLPARGGVPETSISDGGHIKC
jgi:hypothetical protein